MIICESYIKLLRIYRDLHPGHPFVPWLHSTEPNEHLFGVARTIKTDFTYLDFIQLVPKIGSLLLGAFGESMAQAKANATTSGYLHSYYNIKKINVKALLTIPGDKFINSSASASYLEAAQLLEACGIYRPGVVDDRVIAPPPSCESAIEISTSDLEHLVNEEVPVEVFKQSALLGMLRDLENNDLSGFNKIAGSLSTEESQTLQKLSFSEIGQSLGSTQEM